MLLLDKENIRQKELYMSQTKNIVLQKDLVKKLSFISKKFKGLNLTNSTRNFWLVSEENAENYEWESFDIGVNDKGELITCSQSGCSCNSYEFPQEANKKYSLSGELEVEYESYYIEKFSEMENLESIVETLYKLFKTGKYNVDDVLKVKNAEIRRAVIEYVGIDKFFRKAKPKVLDESSFGKLVIIKIPRDEYGIQRDEDIVAVYVKDSSTSRHYFLRVPYNTKTAKEGVAWTFGLDESEYLPIKET